LCARKCGSHYLRFGRHVLKTWLDEFSKRIWVRFSLVLSTRCPNLLQDDIDLANPASEFLPTVFLRRQAPGPNRRVLCGLARYFSEARRSQAPGRPRALDCIGSRVFSGRRMNGGLPGTAKVESYAGPLGNTRAETNDGRRRTGNGPVHGLPAFFCR